jgi:putative transferase (TIGR04331 family)
LEPSQHEVIKEEIDFHSKQMQDQKISTTHVLSSFSLARIELTEKLFAILVPVLNQVHDTQYSDRFWKLVTKEYVNSVISKKEVLSTKLLTSKPEAEPTNSFTLPTLRARIRIEATRFIRYWRSRANEKLIQQKLGKEHNLTLSLPDLSIVQQELGNPLPTYYPFLWKSNKEKRKRVNAIAKNYDDVYVQNIIRQLPGFVVEYFEGMISSIVLIQPEKKVFHVHNFHSLYNTLLVALYVEHGAKLYWYQHGAYYGELIGHNAHYLEATLADTFRTWGWKIRENDEPWKAYRLEKFKKAYETTNVRDEYSCLICFPGFTKRSSLILQSRTNELIEALDFKKYPKVLFRPRPGTPNPIRDLDFVQHKSIVKDDCKQSMAEAVHSSRLVVQMTHPSTNTFECLYVDHPVIAFINNEQPTDVVKPYYDYFLKVGVFHETIESLLKHLNEIEVEEWWRSVKTSEEYRSFKNEFLKAV